MLGVGVSIALLTQTLLTQIEGAAFARAGILVGIGGGALGDQRAGPAQGSRRLGEAGVRVSETLALSPTSSVTIRSSTPEELEVDALYEPGGGPPPAHLHPAQDEHFLVLEGRVHVLVNGSERELTEGDEIEIPRGAAHQMWNPGDGRARVSWRTRPGGRTEQWFRELDSVQKAAREGREAPDFAALLDEYRDVFRLRESA